MRVVGRFSGECERVIVWRVHTAGVGGAAMREMVDSDRIALKAGGEGGGRRGAAEGKANVCMCRRRVWGDATREMVGSDGIVLKAGKVWGHVRAT